MFCILLYHLLIFLVLWWSMPRICTIISTVTVNSGWGLKVIAVVVLEVKLQSPALSVGLQNLTRRDADIWKLIHSKREAAREGSFCSFSWLNSYNFAVLRTQNLMALIFAYLKRQLIRIFSQDFLFHFKQIKTA